MDKFKKQLIIILTLGLSSLTLIAFIIVPSFWRIKKLSFQIQSQSKKIKAEQSAPSFRQTKITQLKKIKNSPLFKKAFISPENELDFIKNLEKIAKLSQVKQKIDISTPQKNKAILTINAEGSYFALLLYLYLLEKQPFYFAISSLTFQIPHTANSFNRASYLTGLDGSLLQLKIKGNIFFQQ